MSDQLHFIRSGVELDPEVKVPMIECGCCEFHHRSDFWGDCRTDSQRFMPHHPVDGEPEYVCANGHHWISDAEWIRREDARTQQADSHPHTPHEKGASS